MNNSRGIRNNNPGNIDYHAGTKWQGLDNPPADSRFCRFVSPAYGIRALAVTLITYFDKYGIRTVKDAIHRWAPPNENDTGAYVRAVAAAIGVAPTDPLDFHSHAHLAPMVEAIIRHENGSQPYGRSQIDAGLRMAGVTGSAPKPLMASRTVQGTAVTGTGVIGSTLLDTANQVQVVADYSDTLRIVFVVLMLAGVGLTLYGRVRLRKQEGV